MCGQFGVPFWEFFFATLIGKAIIKTHIQVRYLISYCYLIIIIASSYVYCDLCVPLFYLLPHTLLLARVQSFGEISNDG